MEAIAENLVATRDLPTLEVVCVTPTPPPAGDASFLRICAAHSLMAIR
jgi:hypothetical protein